MSTTPSREALLTQRVNLDQQIADAAALIAELPEGSADAEAACHWLAESRQAANRIDELLESIGDD